MGETLMSQLKLISAYNGDTMCQLTLIGWSPGLVTNRFIRLLRDNGYGLAQAHEAATRLTTGRIVTVSFDTALAAEKFTDAATQLGVKLMIEQPVGAQS
jgi:hypothetical protein